MQKGLLCEELYKFDELLKRVTILIEKARKNNVEVIYVQHDAGEDSGFTKGDESFEISEQVAPKDNEKVFVKTINSAFGNPEFTNYLLKSKDKELMIVGLQTDFCIDSTIKSAFERGYKIFVPNGTNSTFSNDYIDAETVYKYFNEWVWPDTFAKCISFDDALKLLEAN